MKKIIEVRRDKTEWILEFLEGVADLTGVIMDAFFDSYPSRHRRLGKKTSSAHDILSEEERQRFYSLLSRLKKQGFVTSSGGRGRQQSKWDITQRGLKKLFVIREKKRFSLGNVSYEARKDSMVRVVIFDIPERERHKRVWLRAALLALGFSLCQQSVWLGKSKIPREFLEDLRDREMLSFVQIFEVSREGSLEKVV